MIDDPLMADTLREIKRIRGEVDNIPRPEVGIDLISPFLAHPGCRGFWPMSVFDSSGNAQDVSGHGHHLTYNGNPTYNYVTTFLAPYLAVDGTGDYLEIADTADFDITGTESYVDSGIAGLTACGWFNSTDGTPAAQVGLISKWTGTGNQQAYLLRLNSAGTLSAIVSSDGSAATAKTSAGTISDATWFFAALRFIPSTSVDVCLDGVWESQTTSVPASIFNSTAAFELGALNAGSSLLTGGIGPCALYAAALSDAAISGVIEATRGAFGR